MTCGPTILEDPFEISMGHVSESFASMVISNGGSILRGGGPEVMLILSAHSCHAKMRKSQQYPG